MLTHDAKQRPAPLLPNNGTPPPRPQHNHPLLRLSDPRPNEWRRAGGRYEVLAAARNEAGMSASGATDAELAAWRGLCATLGAGQAALCARRFGACALSDFRDADRDGSGKMTACEFRALLRGAWFIRRHELSDNELEVSGGVGESREKRGARVAPARRRDNPDERRSRRTCSAAARRRTNRSE